MPNTLLFFRILIWYFQIISLIAISSSLLFAGHFVQFSCSAFLLLYAIILLSDFHPAIEIKEIILIIWIFSLIVEEIRQVYSLFALYHSLSVYLCVLDNVDYSQFYFYDNFANKNDFNLILIVIFFTITFLDKLWTQSETKRSTHHKSVFTLAVKFECLAINL